MEIESFSGLWMRKTQIRCVEKVSIYRTVLLREFLVVALAVHTIADDRMAYSAQVDANLVCAAGLDVDFQKRKTAEMFQNPILRERDAPARFSREHFCA